MPSWQTRVVSLVLRLTMKRRPFGGEKEIVEFIRRKTSQRKLLRPSVPKSVRIRQVDENKVKGEWVEATDAPQSTIYYVHGGGYVACSPATHRPFIAALSHAANARVFALDYRLAPEHRFPAAVEDAINGYQWLLKNGEDPANLTCGGDSAGGGLIVSTLMALRDSGAPMPSAAFCISPWTDLTASGNSLVTNDKCDPMFYGDGIRRAAPIYLGDAAATDPLASPIFGDLSTLPPLLIYASNTEVLLDDSLRLAGRAKQCGVEVGLNLWEDLPHAWPILIGFKLPEAEAVVKEIADFIRQRTSVHAALRSAAR